MTWHVYALREPGGGPIRYVGKSSNPEKRLASHRSVSAAKAMRKWIAGLSKDPEIEILASFEDEEAAAIEESARIKSLRASGAKLLNAYPLDTRSSKARELRFQGIGSRLRQRRVELGMTQSALNTASGCAYGVVSRIEHGHRPHITAETAVLLARALDTTVEWLVTGEDSAASRAA